MKVGIIGLGLIGGSMALDLRETGKYQVLGCSRRPETCQQAVERGVVDEASPDLALMTQADLVVICTPLGAIERVLTQLLPELSPETILTDVGSVKAPVVEAIAPRWPNFVGGHPMAGTAESGLDAAQRHLFVGRAYVLTPTPETPESVISVVSTLAQDLQAQLYSCSPQEHDQAVAWISHLPVMVSASLIAACLEEQNPAVLHLAQQFASSGFRDTSRVGGGNPELGVMMASYNRPALIRSLQAYRQQLDQVITMVHQADWRSLEQFLHQTQSTRPPFVE
jgi:arogenate dehydrogenase (NADP+)